MKSKSGGFFETRIDVVGINVEEGWSCCTPDLMGLELESKVYDSIWKEQFSKLNRIKWIRTTAKGGVSR